MSEVSPEVAPATLAGDAPPDPPAEWATADPRPAPTSAAGRLYAVVWRWHFYAGLITAPILWVITLTGALYVFRTELAAWRDRPLLVVEPQAGRLGYDALQEIAARALGADRFDAVAFTGEPDRSVAFVAEQGGGGDHGAEHRHRRVFLDPYTGEVLGSRIDEEDFFAAVLSLHRSLMMGTKGRVLGELATSWGLILLATGVFLWWPRGKSNVGVWAPRLRGKPYAVLRDWHAVAGAYLVPATAIAAGTGLFFSAVWGTGFNTTVQKAGHWAPAWFSDAPSAPPTPGAPPASLDRLVATVLEHIRPGDEATLALSPSPDVAHKAWLIRDDDKNTYRMVSVDRYSARAIEVVDAAELPLLYRVRLWAVSIHMGKIFGTPTKILALVASLALFGLSATGVWMWWVRRPRGRSGFPRRPPPRSLPRWGWAVLVAAGALMPVAGASMILVGALDLAGSTIRRRIG
ncbi:PepSY-associated TM helix domain-containing protein [Tautonia sp. JC769]|uniref:PepSY-associated TM helix domain-containing protein n=1 Tax=Tautonia sp. JC769 TaxID=3232135 RepID=UPI0034589775